MQMALRHLADDVKERFARLRMRHHIAGDDSAAKRRSRVVAQSSAASASGDAGSGDRTETPDLIRPHVDSKTASLPPLPPTPSSAVDRPQRRRRTSAYLCPSASAAVMGHIYEEIPSTTPPLQHQRSGSASSCDFADVGRVYYVSPLDGALCRIFPVDERAVHRRQLACAHVRHHPSIGDDRTSSPPVDVVSVAASGLSAVRGRELRLCAACYHQLRASLAADETAARDCRRRSDGTASPSLSPSFYNSCDLSLLNVPCCYSSEAGDVDHVNDDVSRTYAGRSSDSDAPITTQNGAVSGDVDSDVTANVVGNDASCVSQTTTPTLKFGEAGSAFSKFDGGQRNRTDEGPPKGYAKDNCCDSRRRRVVTTNASFDERRRPLRNADDSLLAVLDSAPDVDIRPRYRRRWHDFRRDVVSGLPGERVNCSKSTSCADVRSARRRSLAVRRRSDDVERRRCFNPAVPSSHGEASSCRRSSACCSGSESSLHGRGEVRSVYYNGLLASMIDLTAASDRSSADDRLSCRATSGPRRSLRPSRQSPSLSDRCQRDRFTSAIRHSSGDLLLRSVQ